MTGIQLCCRSFISPTPQDYLHINSATPMASPACHFAIANGASTFVEMACDAAIACPSGRNLARLLLGRFKHRCNMRSQNWRWLCPFQALLSY